MGMSATLACFPSRVGASGMLGLHAATRIGLILQPDEADRER